MISNVLLNTKYFSDYCFGKNLTRFLLWYLVLIYDKIRHNLVVLLNYQLIYSSFNSMEKLFP